MDEAAGTEVKTAQAKVCSLRGVVPDVEPWSLLPSRALTLYLGSSDTVSRLLHVPHEGDPELQCD